MIDRRDSEEHAEGVPLLAQAEFLRRVALRLARDEHRAADLVQETWIVALRLYPRRPRSLRAWLGAIVRHAAWKLHRGDERRRRLERRCARAESLASAHELAVDRELLHRLRAALRALREPYRTAIVWRYFDGLPPRCIAERLGLPPETVKARLKRGLAMLREGLEAPRPLPARSWRAGLGAWFSAEAHGVARACSALRPAALALPIATAIAVLAWSVAPSSIAPSLGGDPVRDIDGAGTAVVSYDGELASGADLVVRTDAGAPELASATGLSAPRTASASVRVLWEHDGRPAAAIGVRAVAWGGRDPLLHTRRARSDAAGEVTFEALAPGRVVLTADRGGRASFDLVAGRDASVEIAVPCGFDVEGRVLSPHGAPIADAAIWLSEPLDPHEGDFVASSDATGRFELHSVSPGCWIGARASRFAPSALIAVADPGASDAARLEMVLELGESGGDLGGIVVDAHGDPVAGALVLVGLRPRREAYTSRGSTFLEAPGFAVATDAAGRFAAPGLFAGTTAVLARAPGCGAYEGQAVVPSGGALDLRIELPLGARLRGIARDEHGAPLARALVGAGSSRFFAAFTSSREAFLASVLRAGEDGGYELDGLMPGRIEAWAANQAGDRAQATLIVPAGATELWDPWIGASECRGLLLDARGTPLAGWFVEAEAEVESSCASQLRATDAEGRFAFAGPPTSIAALLVREPQHRRICARFTEWPAPGGEARLCLPEHAFPSARMTGSVVDAAGAPIAAARVRAEREREREGADDAAIELVRVDARGRFDVGPLPPDRYRLFIDAPGYGTAGAVVVALGTGERRDLGALPLAPR